MTDLQFLMSNDCFNEIVVLFFVAYIKKGRKSIKQGGT